MKTLTRSRPLLALLLMAGMAPLVSGCVATAIAGATVAVVKAPFQIGGAIVDATTTSQSEADENRGRAMRKQEEADAKAAKKAEKARREADEKEERLRRLGSEAPDQR